MDTTGANSIGNLTLYYQVKLNRPDGVEKNPFTNKNVGKGRRKKSNAAKNKFVPDNMIKQFHRDMSQSSI